MYISKGSAILQMDNNHICGIHGSPFNGMPRLRVLSLKNNRMTSLAESAFQRLRTNIAVLDIDGNPLSCSCSMMWLQTWLREVSSEEGPRCADGSLLKEARLSRQDCRSTDTPVAGCEASSSGRYCRRLYYQDGQHLTGMFLGILG
jgi:hypothetical protein